MFGQKIFIFRVSVLSNQSYQYFSIELTSLIKKFGKMKNVNKYYQDIRMTSLELLFLNVTEARTSNPTTYGIKWFKSFLDLSSRL